MRGGVIYDDFCLGDGGDWNAMNAMVVEIADGEAELEGRRLCEYRSAEFRGGGLDGWIRKH